MLYTIAVVLLILWLLGLVTSYTIGGFIHVLLVIAVVVVLLRIIGGRKPVGNCRLHAGAFDMTGTEEQQLSQIAHKR